MLKSLLLTAALLAAAAAQAAAPRQMALEYDLYRNGQKLGQVTDTFTRQGERYTLTSEMRATGALKVLWPGTIRLESTGIVTPRGLRPANFRHARSDAPHKLATAQLDWERHSIAYHYKGRSWQLPDLKAGAQDQLSQLYQFVFMRKMPADFDLQVVSGRDLDVYRYVATDGGELATPLGALATREYRRILDAPDDKAVTVWIAPARHNLPVQIRVVDDGATLEQRLVRASIQG